MALPALLGHCQTLYDAMAGEATQTGDGLVYEGWLLKLFVSIGYQENSPLYSKVTRTLTDMGAAKQQVRGSRYHPSKWLLIYRPTPQLLAGLDTETVERYNADRIRVAFSIVQAEVREYKRTAAVQEAHLASLTAEVARLTLQVQELKQGA